jgi:hypothetical protein
MRHLCPVYGFPQLVNRGKPNKTAMAIKTSGGYQQLAGVVLPELQSGETITSHDSSTNGLIAFYKKYRK